MRGHEPFRESSLPDDPTWRFALQIAGMGLVCLACGGRGTSKDTACTSCGAVDDGLTRWAELLPERAPSIDYGDPWLWRSAVTMALGVVLVLLGMCIAAVGSALSLERHMTELVALVGALAGMFTLVLGVFGYSIATVLGIRRARAAQKESCLPVSFERPGGMSGWVSRAPGAIKITVAHSQPIVESLDLRAFATEDPRHLEATCSDSAQREQVGFACAVLAAAARGYIVLRVLEREERKVDATGALTTERGLIVDWDEVEGAPPEMLLVLYEWGSGASEPAAPEQDARLRAALDALRTDAPRSVAALLELGEHVESCEDIDEALVDEVQGPARQVR